MERGVELNEIAYLLGYEDSNSFVRGFRNWNDPPPIGVEPNE